MCPYPIWMDEEAGGDVPVDANLLIAVAPTVNQGFDDPLKIMRFMTALYPR